MYTLINMIIIAAAFVVAAALVIVSGTSHNKAVGSCIVSCRAHCLFGCAYSWRRRKYS